MPFLAPPRYLDSVKMQSDIANNDAQTRLIDYKLQQAQAPTVDDELKKHNFLAQVSKSVLDRARQAGAEGSPEFMQAFNQTMDAYKPMVAKVMGDPEMINTPNSLEHVKAFASWQPEQMELKNHLQTLIGPDGKAYQIDTANRGLAMPVMYDNQTQAIDARLNPAAQAAIAGAKTTAENRARLVPLDTEAGPTFVQGGAFMGQDTNPGNIRPPNSKTGFQDYGSAEAGLKAMDDNLLAYATKHGIDTLEGVISRWSPPNENDTHALIAAASKRLGGLDPKQPIDLMNPVIRHVISGAIVQQENPIFKAPHGLSAQEKADIEQTKAKNVAAFNSDLAVQEATRKEQEKTRLKAKEELPKVIRDTGYLRNLLTSLRNHKGLAGVVGVPNAYGALPIPGTQEANFKALLKQVEGDAFLQAFNDLKGGGQITEIEGKKATEAKIRLDNAQTEEAFKSALDEYISVINEAEKGAKIKAGITDVKPPRIESNKPVEASGWKIEKVD